MADIIAIIAIVITLTVYGAWKLHKAENTDLKVFADRAGALETRAGNLETSITNLGKLIEDAAKKCSDNDTEMLKIQDHLARVREQQQRPQKMFLAAKQAIPVEIVSRPAKPSIELKPTSDVLRRTKKQLRELSK